jgi:hypothetical protein
MIGWLRDELRWWCSDFRYRDDPEHAQTMRVSWAKAAEQLGLRHVIGANTFEDRIEGFVEGYQVEVTYVSNFDVQKPETIIRVRSGDAPTNLPTSNAEALLRTYDENAGTRASLMPEERAWIRGHRYGIGISGNHNEVCYHQLWQMYDAADIFFVCMAIVKTIRYLDPNLTKLQE